MSEGVDITNAKCGICGRRVTTGVNKMLTKTMTQISKVVNKIRENTPCNGQVKSYGCEIKSLIFLYFIY